MKSSRSPRAVPSVLTRAPVRASPASSPLPPFSIPSTALVASLSFSSLAATFFSSLLTSFALLSSIRTESVDWDSLAMRGGFFFFRKHHQANPRPMKKAAAAAPMAVKSIDPRNPALLLSGDIGGGASAAGTPGGRVGLRLGYWPTVSVATSKVAIWHPHAALTPLSRNPSSMLAVRLDSTDAWKAAAVACSWRLPTARKVAVAVPRSRRRDL
mmetsp:Transcript_32981/g.74416  ORF Transcript_32981/g.74416 Transcript_32981/m.74416 type:complete len:213 (+) Transcript_32981:93-731(+)